MPCHKSAKSGSNIQVNPWLVALTVSLATFMEVMDTSIANVSLRHIAGDLAAGVDESTWVLTSYLMANAIVLPISGWLSDVLGRKRFYMSCVALFTISSFLCGIAPNLQMLLLFRVLQGAGGGGLAPSEQSILADTFTERQRGQAFALYGMAVVFAPAVGPTLGGYITDEYTWRWIFFINIPVGIVSLFLTYFLVNDSEAAMEEHKAVWKHGLKIDYAGFGLIALGMGCLQVVLDKGQEDDWFGSNLITIMFCLMVIGIVGGIIWESHAKHPVVNLSLFKNKNFATTNVVMFALFFVLLSTTQLLPQLVQGLFGYDATKAGLILMPGGFAIMVLMPFVGRMVNIVQPKYMIVFGLVVTGCSMLLMSHWDIEVSFWNLAFVRTIQASGIAFLFVPINTLAYSGLPKGASNDASAMINLMRNVGGSFGIALANTQLARRGQFHQERLASHITPYATGTQHTLQQMSHTFTQQGAMPSNALHTAQAAIYHAVQQQAQMMSYIDVFRLLAIASFVVILAVLFLKKMRLGEEAVHAH